MADHFVAQGKIADRLRLIDWAQTSVGPLDDWSPELRTAAAVVLNMPHPAGLLWGEQGVILFNDASTAALAGLPLDALGKTLPQYSVRLHQAYKDALGVGDAEAGAALRDALVGALWRQLLGVSPRTLSCTVVPGADGATAGFVVQLCAPTPRAEAAQPGGEDGTLILDSSDFTLQLSDALRRLDDAFEIESVATRMLGERFGADRVNYAEFDHARSVAILRTEYRRDPDALSMIGDYDLNEFASSFKELQAGLPLVISDISEQAQAASDELRRLVDLPGLAQLTVPIMRGGQLVAEMTVRLHHRHRWTPEEIAVAQKAAMRTWEAVERARAEAALRLSEARHRALFEAVDEGVCLFERLPPREDGLRDYRYVAMNPAMQTMFGIPDLSGQSIRDNFPDEVEVWFDDYDRVLETGVPFRIERASIFRDKILEMFVTRVEDATGRMLLAVMQDVTPRKRAEEALRNDRALKEFLLKLSDALRPLNSAGAVLSMATRLIGEHLGVARANYAVVEPFEGAAHYTVQRGYAAPGHEGIEGRFSLAEFRGVSATLRNGRTLIMRDVATDPALGAAEKASFAAIGVGSFVIAPLVRDGRVAAVFAVHDPRPRDWSDVDIVLLERVAERIWEALTRARVEAALRESEANFRALVTATSYVVYRMSPDWREMRQLDGHGFLRDTAEPTTDWLTDYIDPEDQPQVTAAIREAIARKTTFQLEHRVKRPDGSLGWTLSRAIPLMDDRGEIVEWFGAASDVTARREAEEAVQQTRLRLQLAQDAAGVGTFDWVIQGNQGHWSPELLGILGLTEGKFGGTYEDWIATIHPEDRERAAQSITQALEMGTLDDEWRVLRPDGMTIWVLVRGIVENDAAGHPVRLTGAQLDITERVRKEEQVKMLLAELDRQIQSLKRGLRGDEGDAT